MSEHETFGTTQTFVSRSFTEVNEVECPCCLSVVDAQELECNYWNFTSLDDGSVKCHVCSSIIPANRIPNRRK